MLHTTLIQKLCDGILFFILNFLLQISITCNADKRRASQGLQHVKVNLECREKLLCFKWQIWANLQE
jgi:hypothetical protein